MLRKHNRGTMWLGWLCCLIVATATVAQADTLIRPKQSKSEQVSTSQEGPTLDSWSDWIQIGCDFGVMPGRYCPKPIKEVIPIWCQNAAHHHTTLTPYGHAVGVVVDDGVPFKH